MALLSLDGAVIANSGPAKFSSDLQAAQQQGQTDGGDEGFESSRWYHQLWDLWSSEDVYQIENTFSFKNEPFAKLVAGIRASQFREDLWLAIKLSGVFALIIVFLCLLTAFVSSNMLSLARGAMESIEEMEIDSAKISRAAPCER